MKLIRFHASGFRSLKNVELPFEDVNVVIGANASGKSNLVDALRMLHEAVRAKDYSDPVSSRGGIVHLAWKGEEASEVSLLLRFIDGSRELEWKTTFWRIGQRDFSVTERLQELRQGPPVTLLESDEGEGFWWSDQEVKLDLSPTESALAAASADASFTGRGVAEFMRRCGFFDPSPWVLRRSGDGAELGSYGHNLAARLHDLERTDHPRYLRILDATKSIIGLPDKLEFRESEDGRIYFVQREPGLDYGVNQMGASSGTLRMLALMTALYGSDSRGSLIGIEEPENYVHPAALAAFAEHLLQAVPDNQILVTTHSPLLLDFVKDPRAICIATRSPSGETVLRRETNVAGVKKALEESGFGLGEYYETKGFGG